MPVPRLEKSLYERLFNREIFGRARKMGTARKPLYLDYDKWNQYACNGFTKDKSFIGKLLHPFMYWYTKHWIWRYQRDIALQRGYVMDDFYIHAEHEMRRSSFLEHVWRESTHPYQHIFFKARRRRYFKVERTLQGFFVPEHVREEAKQRTMAETLDAQAEWNEFQYTNYTSDMAPATASGMVS